MKRETCQNNHLFHQKISIVIAMYINFRTRAFSLVKILFIICFILILIAISFMWNGKGKKVLRSLFESDHNMQYVPAQSDYDSSSFIIFTNPKKCWYLLNGTRYSEPAKLSQKTGIRDAKLLPKEDPDNDRILNQLMFTPPNYESIGNSSKIQTILSYYDYVPLWKIKKGVDVFKTLNCPVNACRLTQNLDELHTADLVIFHDRYRRTNRTRPSKQLYVLYHHENPFHTSPFKLYPAVFNWTITYRSDSVIPAPYNKFVYYDPRIKQMEQNRNYAANKTKKIVFNCFLIQLFFTAWFVSNCQAKNNRMSYAKELKKYMEVDIYGGCGDIKCPRSDENKCFEMLNKNYKFYLAFENANCKEYITEKFFTTGLQHYVIPIVMGAPPDDYEKYAPLRSYIHVEHFKSPKELAKYLHILDENDHLYNSYFKWRGTGEFLGAYANFWCRMCAMLHDDYARSITNWYKDINIWWRRPRVCTRGYWRDLQ